MGVGIIAITISRFKIIYIKNAGNISKNDLQKIIHFVKIYSKCIGGNMLIILSGSAGVGKNTLITKLLESHNNIKLLQTCTTRMPRSTDKDMHNPYIYLTREEFEQKIKNGELFEHEEIHENFYGMLNSSLEEIANSRDYHYIKDIGVLGQKNIKEALKGKTEVLSIFLTAPKEELIRRLIARGDRDIDLRISRMEFEFSYVKNYDAVIENIDMQKALKEIEKLIKKFEKKDMILKQKNQKK